MRLRVRYRAQSTVRLTDRRFMGGMTASILSGKVAEKGVGVVALVGDHGGGAERAEQADGFHAAVCAGPGSAGSGAGAERVGNEVELGRQTSSTPPQSGL